MKENTRIAPDQSLFGTLQPGLIWTASLQCSRWWSWWSSWARPGIWPPCPPAVATVAAHTGQQESWSTQPWDCTWWWTTSNGLSTLQSTCSGFKDYGLLILPLTLILNELVFGFAHVMLFYVMLCEWNKNKLGLSWAKLSSSWD